MTARRLTAELPLKLQLSVALTLYFCVPYFALQAAPLFPVRTLPLTVLDRAIGFSPGWVWAYQSVYLLMALVPWLAISRDTLHRYARGFVLMSSLAFACFLLMPIAGPRPEDVPTAGMFALLVSYDRPLNAFPSLHCGLAAYSVLLASAIFRESLPPRRRQFVVGLLTVWCLLICYATLATKQHYLVDLPPGMLLAWVCHRWAWRSVVPLATWVPEQARRG